MNKDSTFKITESPEYGTVLRINNSELANQFEDFLAERCYVLFNIKFESDFVLFFFGQASSPVKVGELLDRFKNNQTIYG